jgi:sigma-B regulation protein RsbU (phosphoserine phosphatase)
MEIGDGMGESRESVARLACSELWGGNRKATYPIELPGLLGWVSCTPFGHADSGGDVHYISVCSKGQVSRIALADVAGHGGSASAVAERLRRVLQQHTDNWDQSALMRELNEAFKRDATGVQFATAAALGFYIGTGELLFSNAGHLPLLWHHAESGVWDWLEEGSAFPKNIEGLPLGLISGTTFAQIGIEFGRGDTLLLYTDGITESHNESGEELGHDGLLELVRDLAVNPQEGPVAFGRALVARLKAFRATAPQRDDETLVLIQRQGTIGQIY